MNLTRFEFAKLDPKLLLLFLFGFVLDSDEQWNFMGDVAGKNNRMFECLCDVQIVLELYDFFL